MFIIIDKRNPIDDTPASDTPIFIAPPPDLPSRLVQPQTENSELLPRIALDTEPDGALFP